MTSETPSLSDLLASSPLFEDLNPSQISAYVKGGSVRRVKRGNNLFFKDDPAGTMMIIVSGFVIIETEIGDGEMGAVKLRGPGEVLGEVSLFVESRRTADAKAFNDAELYVWPAKAIEDGLDDDPDLARGMMRLLAGKLAESIEDRVAMMWTVEERLAHTLLDLAKRTGRKQEDKSVILGVMLTQDDLRRLVHCTREHINKALNRWRGEGIVSYEERGPITILKPKGLRSKLPGRE
jgi:CRP/FNR family transcriptional regulator